jgi:TonB family protein
MLRSVLVIVLSAASNLVAAISSGQWAGIMETNGNRVPIYFNLSEYGGNVSGSVATGSLMPIYLAPKVVDSKTGQSIVTGSVGVAIENGEVRNSQLSFQIHDNDYRLMHFRLTLANGVLGGEVTVGGQISKVAVVQIGGGSGHRAVDAASGVVQVGGESVHPGFGPASGEGIGVGGVGGGVFRVGGGVSAPVSIYKVQPQYTAEARAAHYQGTVVLYVEIGPDGMASNIKVQRSLGLGLDEKAVECVKQWKFKPGQKGGKPVPVAATIEVNFRL